MLSVDAANKSLQRHFKFPAPSQPTLMNAIARKGHIAAPCALETHADIATYLLTQRLQLVGDSDRRFRLYSRDRTETPLVKRPIIVRNELHFVSKIDNTLPQSLQIRFGAAARRITATHKSDFQLTVGHFTLTNLVIPGEVEDSLIVSEILRDVSTSLDMTEKQPSQSSVSTPRILPKSLLYSIFARIGGPGLDTDSFEALRASYRGGFLGKAIAYDNRQKEIPASFIYSLRWHPVRLISFLDRPYYYGAKKKYLDWIASRKLATGRYDLFHSWSGDCLRSLQVAKRLGIPSIVEIPTWHRDGGKQKVDW